MIAWCVEDFDDWPRGWILDSLGRLLWLLSPRQVSTSPGGETTWPTTILEFPVVSHEEPPPGSSKRTGRGCAIGARKRSPGWGDS